LPPVWVDLARHPAKLDFPGTQWDLECLGIELTEGLILNVWDADGYPDARGDLIAKGEVFGDAETGAWLLRVFGDTSSSRKGTG
jgi:hypothetical protein